MLDVLLLDVLFIVCFLLFLRLVLSVLNCTDTHTAIARLAVAYLLAVLVGVGIGMRLDEWVCGPRPAQQVER